MAHRCAYVPLVDYVKQEGVLPYVVNIYNWDELWVNAGVDVKKDVALPAGYVLAKDFHALGKTHNGQMTFPMPGAGRPHVFFRATVQERIERLGPAWPHELKALFASRSSRCPAPSDAPQ